MSEDNREVLYSVQYSEDKKRVNEDEQRVSEDNREIESE